MADAQHEAPSAHGDALRDAVRAMHEVREKCVWTQQIDHRDLVPYLVEESAEVIDAVEVGTRDDLREELGDLLWQVLFHAEIASRDTVAPFDIDDVAQTLTEKMVRRHPHVFADAVATTPAEVLVHWNAAKAAEKRARTSVLDGIAHAMPSLALAQKLLARAAPLGVAAPPCPPAAAPAAAAADAPPCPPAAAPAGAATSPDSARHRLRPETPSYRTRLGAQVVSRGRGDGDGGGGDGAPATPGAAGSEEAWGDAVLGMVSAAAEQGWDAERALRGAIRRLETRIRAAEADTPRTPHAPA